MGFFCEVGVSGRGVMGGGHLNFQMGTRPEKSLARFLYRVFHLKEHFFSHRLQGLDFDIFLSELVFKELRHVNLINS